MTIKIDITGGQPAVHLETEAENTEQVADQILMTLEAREPRPDNRGFYLCTSCFGPLWPEDKYDYCPWCGQKIRWED